MSSGYTDCACRDCFDTAVSNDMAQPDFCNECEEAGCEHDAECSRSDVEDVPDCEWAKTTKLPYSARQYNEHTPCGQCAVCKANHRGR